MHTLGADQYVWYFSFYDIVYHKILLKNGREIGVAIFHRILVYFSPILLEIFFSYNVYSNKCRNIF